MHWTEVVAVGIVVAALIPVLLLFFYLGAFAWGCVAYWRKSRRIDVGRKYVAEQGTFTRNFHGWEGEMRTDGRRLAIDVRDEHGLPESTFLRRLPSIVSRLAELEHIARKTVTEVTGEYILDSILSPVRLDDDYEFTLGFSTDDEEAYSNSIYVNFKEDQVVGWEGVD